jgi:hypothetical protein
MYLNRYSLRNFRRLEDVEIKNEPHCSHTAIGAKLFIVD